MINQPEELHVSIAFAGAIAFWLWLECILLTICHNRNRQRLVNAGMYVTLLGLLAISQFLEKNIAIVLIAIATTFFIGSTIIQMCRINELPSRRADINQTAWSLIGPYVAAALMTAVTIYGLIFNT